MGHMKELIRFWEHSMVSLTRVCIKTVKETEPGELSTYPHHQSAHAEYHAQKIHVVRCRVVRRLVRRRLVPKDLVGPSWVIFLWLIRVSSRHSSTIDIPECIASRSRLTKEGAIPTRGHSEFHRENFGKLYSSPVLRDIRNLQNQYSAFRPSCSHLLFVPFSWEFQVKNVKRLMELGTTS